MKCKNIENLMVFSYYGEAKARERRRLDNHVMNCPGCAAKFRAMNADLLKMSEGALKVPEFEWDQSWEKIDTVLERELNNSTKSKLPLGIALKVTATVGIFFLGILVGRLAFDRKSPEVAMDADLSGNINSLLDRHLGSVQVSLLEYLNFSDPEDRTDFLAFEKKHAYHLLFQNRLLTSYLNNTKNPALMDLLEKLNFILQEVVNMSPEKPEYLDFVKSLLRDSEIFFRIDHYRRRGIGERDIKGRL